MPSSSRPFQPQERLDPIFEWKARCYLRGTWALAGRAERQWALRVHVCVSRHLGGWTLSWVGVCAVLASSLLMRNWFPPGTSAKLTYTHTHANYRPVGKPAIASNQLGALTIHASVVALLERQSARSQIYGPPPTCHIRKTPPDDGCASGLPPASGATPTSKDLSGQTGLMMAGLGVVWNHIFFVCSSFLGFTAPRAQSLPLTPPPLLPLADNLDILH